MARKRAEGPGRTHWFAPTWIRACIIGTFPWSGRDDLSDVPSPEYVRAAVYTSLIHGARGILYFSYQFGGFTLKQSKLWEPIGILNREIAEMAPSLLACEPVPVASSDPRVSAARFGRGRGALLLAVNRSESEAVETHLRLPGVRGEARSLFGSDSLPVKAGLTLRLPPYATAAFRLRSS